MRILRHLPGLVLLLFATLVRAASPIPEIKFEKYRLPNGLQVILHEDHSTPIVTVNVWYHAGSKNEQPGRTGFAHLFEHMMFQGSKHHDSDYFAPFLAAGGKLNGSTNQDRTNYWETVPANYLELALWMESDRMGFLLPAMSRKKLDNQRDVVRNERRQSYENRPYGLIHEIMLAALFPADHPYSWSTIGSMADLGNASREDIADFFRRYYHPANASLCIAGDFDSAEAKKLVEKYFAPLPAGPKVEKMQPRPAELKEEMRIQMTDRVGLPRLTMVWPTVPEFADDEPALEILGDILSTGKTSRLEKSLVREKQIAQSVGAGQNSEEIAGAFMIDALAQPGRTPAELETAILEQVRAIQDRPPTAEEVTRALNRIETHIIRGLESHSGFGGLADQLNKYNVLRGDPGYLSKDFARYQKVTPEDIQLVAKKYLGPGRLVLEILPGGEVKIAPDPRIPDAAERDKLAQEVRQTPVPEAQTIAEDDVRKTLPQPGPAPKFSLPPFKRAKLANGLELLVVEKHDLPLVALNLVFPKGKTSEESSQQGLAMLTAALWDEGTKNRTAEQISDELAGIGAEVSFSASWDTTSARLFSLKSRLPKALEIYADLLVNPLFPEKELEREKKMMGGRFQQIRNEPAMLAQLAVGPSLYGENNPYGRPALGTPKSIQSIPWKNLPNFYKSAYVPAGATLIAVGDITAAELANELDRVLADWKCKGSLGPPHLPDMPAAQPTRIILIDKPGAAQSVIAVAQIAAERKSPDYYPLNVMNAIFGGQFMSRLNLNLRETKGYTYGARSSFEWHVHAPGAFTASSSVKTDATAPALVEFLKEIDGLRGAIPIKPEELADAKDYLTRGFPSEFETISQIAGRLETLVEYHLPDDYFNAAIPNLAAVTGDDVQAAAKKYIHPNNLAIIIVGDRGKIEKSLAELPAGKNLELLRFDDNFQLVPAK
ncbi:MAG: insulinase family protein [Pirellulales bacterium]|nr:insulinase family protein [Pirellulales bacterium]